MFQKSMAFALTLLVGLAAVQVGYGQDSDAPSPGIWNSLKRTFVGTPATPTARTDDGPPAAGDGWAGRNRTSTTPANRTNPNNVPAGQGGAGLTGNSPANGPHLAKSPPSGGQAPLYSPRPDSAEVLATDDDSAPRAGKSLQERLRATQQVADGGPEMAPSPTPATRQPVANRTDLSPLGNLNSARTDEENGRTKTSNPSDGASPAPTKRHPRGYFFRG